MTFLRGSGRWMAGLSLFAAQGTTKPAQLKTALQRSADDLGKKGTDAIYSKGRLNVLQLVN